MGKPELFISVDIEATGPTVGVHSMYEIGACRVNDLGKTFVGRLSPIGCAYEPQALKAVGTTWRQVRQRGEQPMSVMLAFDDWLRPMAKEGQLVFMGFNAGYDWKFVDWYFAKYVGRNPFGHAPFDVKAYVMGVLDCDWRDTKMSRLPPGLKPDRPLSHNALDDAILQAQIFNLAREQRRCSK